MVKPLKYELAVLRQRRHTHGIEPFAADPFLRDDNVERRSRADIPKDPATVSVVLEYKNWFPT